MFFFDFFLICLGVLMSVAFFTLVERKFLGFVHFRKGPMKVYWLGLSQPIADAVKLFCKETMKGYKFSVYMYMLGPMLGLFLMLILWSIYGTYFGCGGSIFSFLYVFCFFSLGVYVFLFSGWGSNSKYALLGAYRSVSQSVSYEISMIFFGLFLVYLIGSYDFSFFPFFQTSFWFFFISFYFFLGWGFIILAESMRTPFDFSEGESELVSGFNVEYGGGFFSFIFIAEYGMILFLSFLSVLFFCGAGFYLIKILFFAILFVWVRCSFPRYRYDFLMKSAWEVLLPFSLSFVLMSVVMFL